ncbi:MAG: GNAT family N-acetyltransferase [Prevotella sp.]
MANYSINILTRASDDDVQKINHLLGLLTTHAQPVDVERLKEICQHSMLLVAREENSIIGMLSLCHSVTPTRSKWLIEDVVVDESARGKGIGRRLISEAIDCIKANGGGQIELTSRPARIAANKLYQSIGFEKKETNVYVMKI